jgi:hypothetical protein
MAAKLFKLGFSDDAAQLLDRLFRLPIIREQLGEDTKELVATRRGLIAKLARIEGAAAAELPKLAAQVDEAIKGVRQAEAALREACQLHAAAMAARHNYSFSFGRAHDGLEQQLKETASPEIDAFVNWAMGEFHDSRHAPLVGETVEAETPDAFGHKGSYLRTNSAAVARRMSALLQAADEAKQLAISEADPAAIEGKLDAIRNGIPS